MINDISIIGLVLMRIPQFQLGVSYSKLKRSHPMTSLHFIWILGKDFPKSNGSYPDFLIVLNLSISCRETYGLDKLEIRTLTINLMVFSLSESFYQQECCHSC